MLTPSRQKAQYFAVLKTTYILLSPIYKILLLTVSHWNFINAFKSSRSFSDLLNLLVEIELKHNQEKKGFILLKKGATHSIHKTDQ